MQHYESNACDRREWNGVWAARHAGGLTLLEVMIAIAVVVTAATAILCGLSAAYANERVSSEQIAAQNLARRMQEELMGVPFDDLIPNYDATSVTSGGLRALLNVNQAQPASGAPTLLRIQVRVRRLGEANDILSLVTLRSDRRAPRSAWLSSPSGCEGQMKSVRTQSGFTLIEVAIACAVASVLILLVGSLFKKSTEGLEYLTSIGQAELQMRRAIDRIVEDIQQAAIDTSVPGPYPDPVTIAAGASHDTVAIQRARGADPTVNAAENIETVTYSVNAASELVRSIAWQQAGVLYSDGPRVIARHVDGLAGGQKGFAITRVVGTSLYTVSLRVAIDLNDGTHTQLKREYRTTARIRV